MSSPQTADRAAPGPGTSARPFAAPALAVTGTLVVGQLYAILPVLGPVAADWGTDDSTAAWAVTAFAIAYAAGFLVWGPAADRCGPRRVILLGIPATALLTLMVPLAPAAAPGLALRALQGFAAASFAPAAFGYIATHIPVRRRVTAITWLTTCFLASTVIGQLAAQAVGQAAGWRWVFFAGAACLAAAALLLRLVLAPDQTPADTASQAPGTIASLLRTPGLPALYGTTATVLFGLVAVYSGLELAGPDGPAPDGPAPDTGALLAMRAGGLPVMFAVPLLSGVLAGFTPKARIRASLAGAALCAALLAPLAGTGPLATGVLLAVLAGCVTVASPALVQAIGERAKGAGATALYTFVLFIGAGTGPQLAAALSAGGFTTVALGASAVLALGCALSLIPPRRPGQGA